MTRDPNDRKHLRLVTNAELKRLIESREGSGFVTMLHPLEMFASRDALDALTRQSLDAIRSYRKENETDDERMATDRAIQQRVDFLSWLTSQPDHVYMAMYPADMDGLDDIDDLDELLGDDQSELPF